MEMRIPAKDSVPILFSLICEICVICGWSVVIDCAVPHVNGGRAPEAARAY